MIKKRKKQNKYIFRNKEFTTFKNMKTYAYFNMGVSTEEEVWEINEDQIMKTYKLIKQERRLLCIISKCWRSVSLTKQSLVALQY